MNVKKVEKKIKKHTSPVRFKKHPGFSLIELIIVTGIIALISTLAIVSITKARVEARDSARAANTRNMVLALESYYAKHNAYPALITPGPTFQDSEGTVFMSQTPKNPTPHTDGFCLDRDFHYESFAGGQNYILTFCLGNEEGTLKKGINFYSGSGGGGGTATSCGATITDRDGYTYNTVQIGGQCWMAQNLRSRTKPDGTALTTFVDGSERDCNDGSGFHGTETDCDLGHAIYLWDAAMNGSTTAGAQGLCMDGWHVPTDAEWHELENFLKNPGQSCDASRANTFDCDDAGSKLLVGGNSGFNGLTSGLRAIGGMFPDNFYDFDDAGYFWSSSSSGTDIYGWSLNDSETRTFRGIFDSTSGMSLSIRCLKNY